mgnify:CR=1 FL=1
MKTDITVKTDLHWIQALRGIAALMVLFFHMHPHWDLLPTLSVTSVITRWGFSGVDIFFTLSGFVVYRSALRTIPANGIKPFALKRFRRIYMGYWPVLLLIALTTVWVYEENLPPLQKMIFSTLLLYPNIWDNWLPPAWSLTMEIYFYLWIIPIAILPPRHQIKVIVLVMLVLAAWGIAWVTIDPQGVFAGYQPLRYGLTGLGLEFLAGALVAHAYDRRASIFRTHKTTIPLCLLLIALGFGVGSLSPFFDRVEVMRAASFGVVGLATLVIALCLEQTRFSPPTWLVAVGDASYSLYLLHTFLLDASGRMRMSLGISEPQSLLFFLLALPVAIVGISMLWFRCIERPLLRAAR